MSRQDDSPGIGIKLIALLLMFGGIYGAIWELYIEWQAWTSAGAGTAALVGLCVLLFGWSTWVGFELWHGERWAFKVAKVIFGAQIPIFALPGFSFDGFYTGFRVYLMIRERPPNIRFGFNAGSGINFLLSPQVDYWFFGVNLVAVIALIHLIRTTDKGLSKDKFGLI